jgi:hypothetical protein
MMKLKYQMIKKELRQIIWRILERRERMYRNGVRMKVIFGLGLNIC